MAAIRQILVLGLVALLGLTACSPTYENHGYIPPERDLAQIVVGQTSIDMIPQLTGHPSAQGLLTGSGWFYVGSRWRHFGPLKPEEISREVVVISFDQRGIVSNVERFGLERGRVVTLSRRVTETSVSEISLIGQLLGNLGNFQAGQFLDE